MKLDLRLLASPAALALAGFAMRDPAPALGIVIAVVTFTLAWGRARFIAPAVALVGAVVLALLASSPSAPWQIVGGMLAAIAVVTIFLRAEIPRMTTTGVLVLLLAGVILAAIFITTATAAPGGSLDTLVRPDALVLGIAGFATMLLVVAHAAVGHDRNKKMEDEG